MTMQRFRSKVVEIEAMINNGDPKEAEAIGCEISLIMGSTYFGIWNSLEGQFINCPNGHYIIKGLKGEFYPCDPEIFAAKYEPIES